jgi:hypothetical protein
MRYMFRCLYSTKTSSGWNVAKVTDMDSMFLRMHPTKTSSGWNVSAGQHMGMFYGASAFNQDLWMKRLKVTDMGHSSSLCGCIQPKSLRLGVNRFEEAY